MYWKNAKNNKKGQIVRRIIITIILLFTVSFCAKAQFNNMFGANNSSQSNTQSEDSTYTSSEPKFSFKKYFNALGHKDTMSITYSFAGSVVLPGTAQIYNKDYWKLPVIYLGAGGLLYGGIYNQQRYKSTLNKDFRDNSTYFYIGAAFIYWASLLDGVICYESKIKPLPQRAALYSALLPEIGRASCRERV